MAMQMWIADFSAGTYLAHPNIMLPVAVGVVAGMGVVGLIHCLIRPRKANLQQAAADVKQQTDPFVFGSATENRKAFRRQGNPVEVSIVNQQYKDQPFKGYVTDRSVGGLCLLLEGPLAVGASLTVRPVNAPHIAPWIDITVKSCRESNPGFEVGCQFVKTPPWAVLLMFG
jgi:hypothetical protein